jgi:hypothetical protein
VAELADAQDLGSCTERCRGSTPLSCIFLNAEADASPGTERRMQQQHVCPAMMHYDARMELSKYVLQRHKLIIYNALDPQLHAKNLKRAHATRPAETRWKTYRILAVSPSEA